MSDANEEKLVNANEEKSIAEGDRQQGFESEPKEGKSFSVNWKLDFIFLCIMLGLALVGMGVTQAFESGAWEFWFLSVVVYAGIGIYRDWATTKHDPRPIWKRIGKQLLHWAGLLLVMKLLVLTEQNDAISRESASIAALLLIAITCYLAGLHFHLIFGITGVFLAIMAFVIGTLEQYLLVTWLVMLPSSIAGLILYYWVSGKIRRDS